MPRALDINALTAEKVSFGPRRIYQLVSAGEFPAPVKIGGGNKNLWLESEVDAWILAQFSMTTGRK